MGDPPKVITFNSKDNGIVSTANPRCVFGDDVQHRLNVSGRAGDDTEDFTCCGLLLQGFGELLEQPHIFDGDQRLVGEGFKKLDLRWGEGAHLGATCVQRSDELPLLTKGQR